MSMIIEHEVMLYGKIVPVGSLQEAIDKMKRVEYSDFAPSYIIQKEYTDQGILVQELMLGI